MYVSLAIFAIFLFCYSVVAGRIEKSIISGPMIFVFSGFVMGSAGLGWMGDTVTQDQMRVLADLTLALVLFIDAANADLSVLRKQMKIPSRMLLIGLPGVILLGFGFAVLLFDELSIYEAAILATMLAATDAALGKAVIVNKIVPVRVREALNAESGLNDGLCVPVLLFFIALATAAAAGDEHTTSAIFLIVKELGIGSVVGLSFAAVGAAIIHWCWKQGWLTKIWIQMTVVALALASFAVAQELHGSGYIAAFVGGLLFGSLAKEQTHDLVLAAEGTAESLAMITWLIFGAAVVGQTMHLMTWEVVIYALLSLTVIRVLPIFLSLVGTGENVSSRLFLGWFGPRGLASIVFAIIVLEAELPGSKFLAIVVVATVFASLVAHGVTAKPLAAWLSRREGTAEPVQD
jgi:NhaP-type Na+/H+ or K+/H+ antiporter